LQTRFLDVFSAGLGEGKGRRYGGEAGDGSAILVFDDDGLL
jgi:hypothetical protein